MRDDGLDLPPVEEVTCRRSAEATTDVAAEDAASVQTCITNRANDTFEREPLPGQGSS